jgi:hypothetical protein
LGVLLWSFSYIHPGLISFPSPITFSSEPNPSIIFFSYLQFFLLCFHSFFGKTLYTNFTKDAYSMVALYLRMKMNANPNLNHLASIYLLDVEQRMIVTYIMVNCYICVIMYLNVLFTKVLYMSFGIFVVHFYFSFSFSFLYFIYFNIYFYFYFYFCFFL